MVFIVNYRAAIIGSLIKGLIKGSWEPLSCSVVLNRCRLKHSYLLQVKLLGRCRVSSTPAGALHRGHCIERHRSASEVYPVLLFLPAPGEQDADIALKDHPSNVRHANHAISATRATIQTVQNKVWRAAARQKYSSLSFTFLTSLATMRAVDTT